MKKLGRDSYLFHDLLAEPKPGLLLHPNNLDMTASKPRVTATLQQNRLLKSNPLQHETLLPQQWLLARSIETTR